MSQLSVFLQRTITVLLWLGGSVVFFKWLLAPLLPFLLALALSAMVEPSVQKLRRWMRVRRSFAAGVVTTALLLVAVPVTSPGVLLATLLCTCLAPVAGQFGWGWGLAAGFIHMTIVQNTSILHGGMNLYNNGFAAGLVCILLIPIIKSISPEPEED